MSQHIITQPPLCLTRPLVRSSSPEALTPPNTRADPISARAGKSAKSNNRKEVLERAKQQRKARAQERERLKAATKVSR